MNLTDFQKQELEELGDDPVKASLQMHRNKLEKTSDKALDQIDEQMPTMTPNETIKAYEATRKQLNTIDGRTESTQQNNFFILPGELANNITSNLDKELEEQLQIIDVIPEET